MKNTTNKKEICFNVRLGFLEVGVEGEGGVYFIKMFYMLILRLYTDFQLDIYPGTKNSITQYLNISTVKNYFQIVFKARQSLFFLKNCLRMKETIVTNKCIFKTILLLYKFPIIQNPELVKFLSIFVVEKQYLEENSQ